MDLFNEIANQTSLKHPNIMKMYGYFHNYNNIYLILEYIAGGNLSRWPFDTKTVAKYTHDLSVALAYMHFNKIAHRDLKLENLLLGPNGTIKIADFGFSVEIPIGKSRMSDLGSLYNQPPDMVLCQGHNYTTDAWTLGVIVFALLTDKLPFCYHTCNSCDCDKKP